MTSIPTAAVLIIGDEVLSGRTKDKNMGFIADYLTALGIDLKEARFVPDQQDEIISAVNALRHKYTYVFTTGGIGPTHDDITADAIGAAFGLTVTHNKALVERLTAHFTGMGKEANEARLRMARIPQTASLIENEATIIPGFRVENVFVMAGVPRIMQSMMKAIEPSLEHGTPLMSKTLVFEGGEGEIAAPLGALQARYPEVMIGSYPFETLSGYGTNLIMRSRDSQQLENVWAELQEIAKDLTNKGLARGWSIG